MGTQALPGRDVSTTVADKHFVNGNKLQSPFDRKPAINSVRYGLFLGG